MIGGRGGTKIRFLSPAEWLERRWRELRGISPRTGRPRVLEGQSRLELDEGDKPEAEE